MLIYIDTEFTNLFSDNFKLISAGFVTESGKEFYFELTDNYTANECSAFVHDEVLPYLNKEKYGLSTVDAATYLKEWIEQLGEQVKLASDAPAYDFGLIQDLLEPLGWPANLDVLCIDVYDDQISCNADDYFIYMPMAVRHHALWDARALKSAVEKS